MLAHRNHCSFAVVAYLSYVLKTIWPKNLAVFYPHPGNTLPVWQIFGAGLLIATTCFLAIRASRKYPYIAVGLFWFLGTLVPVIGLVQVGDQAMADRYTYIPLIGLFIIVAWGISDLYKKWHYRNIFFGVSAAIILSAMTVCTSYQLTYWKNSITLFEHTIKVTNNNYQAQNNLGTALDPVDIDQAIFHYKEALKIKPDYAMALFNLGSALEKKGNIDEAIRIYKEIIKASSVNADAHYNLAYVLSIQGKLDEAVLHYKATLKINPKYSKAYYNLGNILIKRG